MPSPNIDMLDAPIPGQALVGELGSKPWERPPKYSSVEDALSFYIERLSKASLLGPLLDEVEKGIPISTIVDAIQISAVMEGIHTLDVGLLAAPVLVEFIAVQAEEADIKFTIGDEESDLPDEGAIDALVDGLVLGETALPQTPSAPPRPPLVDEVDTVPEEEPAGLMSKRIL